MSTPSEEIWDLLRDVIRVQRANAEQFQETDRKFQETDRKFQDTDRQLKELGKQIGGLGEKFGSFTEGLALPSMERLLRERFGMEVVSPSVRVSKGGRHLEIDTLAYANGEVNAAYLVEVTSHLREEGIDQLSTLLEQFRDFFPEHRDKRLYGILAAVDASPALRERALRKGFYVARIHDAVFELDVPEGFQPRVF
jgi:thymidylate synthase